MKQVQIDAGDYTTEGYVGAIKDELPLPPEWLELSDGARKRLIWECKARALLTYRRIVVKSL